MIQREMTFTCVQNYYVVHYYMLFTQFWHEFLFSVKLFSLISGGYYFYLQEMNLRFEFEEKCHFIRALAIFVQLFDKLYFILIISACAHDHNYYFLYTLT